MVLTNSRFRAGRECPRKEYLAFDLMLEPAEKPDVLAWGSAFHAELAGIEYEANPYVRASARRAAQLYQEPVEILAREVPFEIPLINPDTGHASTKETLGGTIDALGRLRDGRLVIVERKTTSRPVEDLFARLDIDTQVLTYWLGARELGHDVSAVLYCVQPRPAQRPLKATPVEARKYTKDGKLYASQRERDETPEEYAERCVIEPPHFREVPVLSDAIERHRRELWGQHQVRLWMRREGYSWRNPAACEDCWFLPICGRSDLENTVPEGFIRRASAGQAAQSVPA